MKATLVFPQELDAECIRRWERLRAENPAYASPFYSPHFARAVGEVRRDAQVAIFERQGRIVGFLPFHRVRKRIAKPIGGHFNDYHGAILAPGLALSDPGLLESAGIQAYDFDHLPAQFGHGTKSLDAGQASPQMDLRGGYDRCVAAKGGSWKRGFGDMARKARKMERELGPVRFEFASGSADMFERHAAMRNALYRRMGQREDYCTGWEGEVLHGLRQAAYPDFRSVLNVLYAGSLPVAAHFGLVSQGVLHWWFPAYELAAQRYSPGLQLIDHCARHAAGEEITAIDFGKGEDRYKSLFADRSIPMLKGSACSKGSLAAKTRAASARLLSLVEEILPGPVRSYPRRSVERLWTGTVLPRLG
jgi:CelD/BcsL family acetyltransferase involved in cellulose biosynthesis